ncbi:MAG: efflux RND transporter permease subunit [Pseudomonadales bacterium]|nr:efflux RND transporter permease subunit [Pseudomonadales bacterium]
MTKSANQVTDSLSESARSEEHSAKGMIAWFARNSVAANLLMLFIVVAGVFTANTIRKQMFPQVESNWLTIQAAYPGAAPQEVEDGITRKVEEELQSIQGLERVITYSSRGAFTAYIKVDQDYEPDEVLDDVKRRIDVINSLPDGMERPLLERIRYRQEVAYISLYGDLSLPQLRELGNQIHDELLDIPEVHIAEFYGGLDYEISVEVSKDKLREYNLRFTDIASAIRNYSANRSAGQIRAEQGYISLRVENQAYHGFEFESLPILTRRDGTQVLLSDIAEVRDGFEEGIQYSRFNGKNSVTFFVGATRSQSITDISKRLQDYVEQRQARLPDGVSLDIWVDLTYYLEGRLDMMLENMQYGAVLVFLILALFLRIKLAFWVMLGLPISFLGALFILPMEWVDVTINVTSLFGFILVLGIVVDDAIVIGESAHAEIETKGQSLESVIRGAQRVAMPATFGVLTTVAAFMPMVLSDGPESAFSQSIGFVVIFCLLFSLIESKLILPAHLASMRPVKDASSGPRSWLIRTRGHVDAALKYVVSRNYLPLLAKAITYRYGVLTIFISILVISAALYYNGMIRFVGTPKIPHDFPSIEVEMQAMSSESATLGVTQAIQQTIRDVDQALATEFGSGMVADIQVDLRSRVRSSVMVKLIDPEQRPIDTFELAKRWREALPDLPGVKRMKINDNLFGSERDDGDLRFQFKGRDEDALEQVVTELRDKLRSLKGVGEINDSRKDLTHELRLVLKPVADSLGLTLADVATQVGYGFYGLEAQRVLRRGEEIKVMVRYPESQRNGVGLVDDILIRTVAGAEVPLSEIAEVLWVPSEEQIRREDGARNVSIWASVNSQEVEPQVLMKQLKDEFIPELLSRYPGVTSEAAGRIKREMDSQETQLRNFVLSLLAIYALLAIPLRSYAQPLMIMSVIPFGIVGAMLGHILLGMDMSSLSMFGVIAAAGVVVNDSLVMVDFVNRARAEGIPLVESVIQSGARRFRAIILTSLTTFIGLIPIILESSLQAQIVIPMAVSLAFGVLFATVITLLLVPVLYVIGADLGRFVKWSQTEAKPAEN